MFPEIGNAASYKFRSVIRFLLAKSMSTAEMHRELWPADNG
jgi:hypothetical protein